MSTDNSFTPDSTAAISSVLDAIHDQLREIRTNRSRMQAAIQEGEVLERKLNKAYFELTGKNIDEIAFAYVTNQPEKSRLSLNVEFANSSDMAAISKRFWRKPSFEGWKVYTLNHIKRENRFVSLSEFVEMTGEQDRLERKALQSAISNALSTSYGQKLLGAVTLVNFKGKFYGFPSFFDDTGRLKPEYVKKLMKQTNLDDLNFEFHNANKSTQDDLIEMLGTK